MYWVVVPAVAGSNPVAHPQRTPCKAAQSAVRGSRLQRRRAPIRAPILGSEQGLEGSDEPPSRPRQLGDEAELFRQYDRLFRRTVQRLVNTSPDIVDDACNFAWTEFVRYQPDRNANWRSWLVTVAQREAWRLDGKERGHIGLEVGGESSLVHEPADARDVVSLRSELRFALEVLATVPARRREVKAMHVTGLKYEEIQHRFGLSYTQVNRLMTEANQAIQKERQRVTPRRDGMPARAARLQELEEKPPKWLTRAIGRPPGKHVPAQIVLPWRRAALAIDDYRREHGVHVADDALGARPTEPRAARAFDLADRARTRAREAREATRRRSLDR
jgi:RNA polymerase sigma factor (sigma-70 family)